VWVFWASLSIEFTKLLNLGDGERDGLTNDVMQTNNKDEKQDRKIEEKMKEDTKWSRDN
jgi:hypothetical protein